MVELVKRKVEEVLDEVKEDDSGPKTKFIDPTKLIPTGSTMLNLALSDASWGGYHLGTFVNLIGDKSAGKTFLSWNMFADIVHQNRFPNHELIYDDVERRLKIDIVNMFGQKTDDRVIREETQVVESWYEKARKKIKKKEKFIWCLDSLDFLTTLDDQEKTKLEKEFPIKALLLTQMLERLWANIEAQDALLHVISQTRQNIGFGAQFTPRRRAGGEVLGFVATHEIWLAVVGHPKRGPKDSRKEVGVDIQARVTKNSLTGKRRVVEFSIYYDYGVDDLGSIIDWLVKEGFWNKDGQTLKTQFIEGTKARVIEFIEQSDLEDELRKYVGACWLISEERLRTKRKKKYE